MTDVTASRVGDVVQPPAFLAEIRRRVREQPARTALSFLVDGELENAASVTYADLDRQARSFAGALRRSAAPGDRVLILAQPGLEFVSSFLGCLYAGQVAVAASLPGLSKLSRFAPKLRGILGDARPRTVLAPRQVLSRAESLVALVPELRDLRWLSVEELCAAPDEPWIEAPTGPDAVAFLQYTSGSTGTPKGVMVSHGNIAANCAHIAGGFGLDERSVMVSWLPPYHDMGLIGCILAPLYNGFPCTMMSPMAFIGQPLRWLRAISHTRATISGGPNFAYEYCVRRTSAADRADLDLRSWQLAFNGAETVRGETLARFAEAFAPAGFRREAFMPCYGLAEATLLVACCDPGARPVVTAFSRAALARHRAEVEPARGGDAALAGAGGPESLVMVGCGAPRDGTSVVIADPDTRHACSEAEVGEIWVAGPAVARGYWSKPDETAGTFCATTADGRGPFLRTGDLGFVREGHLHVSGRIKDLLVLRGQNFYAHDLVATAASSHPGLMASGGAAFTVDAEGEDRLVVVHEWTREAAGADPEAVLAGIREAITETHELALHAAVLIPSGALPRTTSGKVRHQECRRQYLAGALKVHAEWRAPAAGPQLLAPPERGEASRLRAVTGAADAAARARIVGRYVRETLGRALGRGADRVIGPETPVSALNLDSVRMVTLAGAWERDLGVRLELPQLFACETVDGLARLLERAVEQGAAAGGPWAQAPAPLQPAPAEAHRPFPLTDVQRAYWVGRSGSLELGKVSCYAYLEVDGPGLELPRLERAWQRLVERHGMLRAVFLPDGTQRVLPEVPCYRIEELDLRDLGAEAAEERLQAVRAAMSEQVLPSDRWPLFDVRVSRRAGGATRLHVGVDLLIADVHSLRILFEEWTRLYEDETAALPGLELSFRDCVLADVAAEGSPRLAEDRRYWEGRLPTLPPPPALPLACSPGSLAEARFSRRSARLEPATWERLRERAAAEGLTPSGALLAAYAEVLAAWSQGPRFLLGVTLFNRPALHPQILEVVGDFTGLTVLEVDSAAGDTFRARAASLRDQLQRDLGHRAFSGVRVLRELATVRSSSVLAPVVFTSNVGQRGAGAPHPLGAFGQVGFAVSQTPQVWLDHQIHELDDGLHLHWDAVEALFPPGLLDDMFEAYVELLRRLAEDGEAWRTPRAGRPRLPVAQRHRRRTVNATDGAVPQDRLNGPFLARALERPGAPAIVCGDRTLTYGELGARVRDVAARLRELGAGPGQLVGVVMEKGWEQVVAVLGVLQAGAAYLPLDVTWPAERLARLLADGDVRVALTQPRWLGEPKWPAAVRPVPIGPDAPGPQGTAPAAPAPRPDELAYVIYTSGSTGTPKGVMITHQGALNTVVDVNERFGVGPADRVLAVSALSFDLSVYDVFGVLAAGGCVVVPEPRQLPDPQDWVALVERHGVTVWNTVPAFVSMLVEYLAGSGRPWPASLRLVLMSGDWIPVDLPGRIAALAPRCKVVSLGGATEASIWSIVHPIDQVDPRWRSIPYGVPLRNQRFHVLDERLEDRPDWVPGELLIGGVGVAAGYWRDAEKTSRSFVTHPVTGERLYRTGDLGRYLPDGSIELLGRQDQQVKIGGYRIELGEIESVLGQHPSVREAVVLGVPSKGGGTSPAAERRLAAFVVAKDSGATPATLAAFLSRQLPAYMVPPSIELIAALPLSSNGKIDRSALARDLEQRGTAGPASPRAPAVRTKLLAVLASTLNRTVIEPGASLLELGANSLDVVRIANRFEQELGFRPSLQELIRFSTASQLVEHYEAQLVRDATLGGVGVAAPGGEAGGSYELILDAEARAAFRRAEHGLRRDPSPQVFPLPPIEPGEEALRPFRSRRSVRDFGTGPLSAQALGGLLGALRQARVEGKAKYRYGSGGGLYPVQVYLALKPGAVTGYQGGTYYYHPAAHRLQLLVPEAPVGRELFTLSNQQIFDASTFAIFLVGELDAIGPLYGSLSRDLCLIEAGLMTQVLETEAPVHGVGLCQIGGCEFAKARSAFQLRDSHQYLHCLLGGPVELQPEAAIEAPGPARGRPAGRAEETEAGVI